MTSPNTQASLIMNIADIIRGGWKRYEFQDVILPLVVIKRIDSVLADTKKEVRSTHNQMADKVSDSSQAKFLKKASGYQFYNTSPYDLNTLLEDSEHIYQNFNAYIESFNPNVRDILDKFEFNKQLERLKGGKILYLVLKELDKVDLNPKNISNHDMGYIFEELIRRFNEQSNETAGEHYTPREVISLMVRMLLETDKDTVSDSYKITEIYDPCCGTGGMLTTSKDYITEHINQNAKVYLYGQELNPQTYAIAKSDLLIKGEDVNRIKGGESEHSIASTLSNDQFHGHEFDYVLANPPYGTDWKKDRDDVEREAARGDAGRFPAGLPAVSDGQLLFLQHMLSKIRPVSDGGGRVAVVHNGSPLFSGGAGSGPSEIRRYLLEHDLLETIVALPTSMFYNTGISTYVWILSNRKPEERQGKVQLIDASEIYHKLRKNLGEKNKELTEDDIQQIFKLYEPFEESKKSKIFDYKEFGYIQVTVERPLQLNFTVNPERIERLRANKMFQIDPESKKKPTYDAEQIEEIFSVLGQLDSNQIWQDREEFTQELQNVFKSSSINLDVKLEKLILNELSEHDENAPIIKKKNGDPEPNPDLRDTEHVPLTEDVDKYFEREVKPHVPGAWMVRKKDKIGYEIPFNRYFYEYTPPRDLEEIDQDLEKATKEILELLQEVKE